MNTSGPSSRPRKPYPLALLNHLTVPFKRSTCAPPLFADFPRKGAIPGGRKNCVGIVLLTGGTVKARCHTSVVVGRGWRDGYRGRLLSPWKNSGFVSRASLWRCEILRNSFRAGHRSRSLYLARRSRYLSQPQDPGDGLG